MYKFALTLCSLFLLVGIQEVNAQCSSSKKSHARQASYQQHHRSSDIVDVVAGAEKFSTLFAAVKAADLVETLKSDGNFTVFAPTNNAFAKIPADALEGLLKPSAKKDLTNILTYHVLPARVSATELIGAIKANGGEASLTMVNGGTLKASMNGNSVIHEIDTVVMPR